MTCGWSKRRIRSPSVSAGRGAVMRRWSVAARSPCVATSATGTTRRPASLDHLIAGEPLHPARQPRDAAVGEADGGVDEVDGAEVHCVNLPLPMGQGSSRLQPAARVSRRSDNEAALTLPLGRAERAPSSPAGRGEDHGCVASRYVCRKESIGFSPPASSWCQKVQPLHAGVPCKVAPSLWIDPT